MQCHGRCLGPPGAVAIHGCRVRNHRGHPAGCNLSGTTRTVRQCHFTAEPPTGGSNHPKPYPPAKCWPVVLRTLTPRVKVEGLGAPHVISYCLFFASFVESIFMNAEICRGFAKILANENRCTWDLGLIFWNKGALVLGLWGQLSPQWKPQQETQPPLCTYKTKNLSRSMLSIRGGFGIV